MSDPRDKVKPTTKRKEKKMTLLNIALGLAVIVFSAMPFVFIFSADADNKEGK
jgi:hypothetical protein